ncbi:MAG: lamin tail domain-containing protein [Planctomycetes bacterium]|nr:lamin tail domain-containing protein [Planctomycetota bacterium]
MSDPVRFILVMFIFCTPLAGLTLAVDCPAGDLHPDCKIDIQDLSLFAQQWLDAPCSGTSCADFTGGDGVNIEDFAVLAINWQEQEFPLVINEFMAKNDSFVQDPTGDFDDWVEIYNYSGATIDIAGMYLTDTPTDPLQDWWQVPVGYPAETTILPQGFMVIWADEQTNEGPLHANFKLSAGGETIALLDPDKATVDSITFGAAQGLSDESYGRFPDGAATWQTFTAATTVPSPGQSNGSPTIDIVINEVMYHPSSELDAEEYIELYNNGNGPVNLAGWQFSEGVAYTFGNVTIESGQYLVVAADVSAFTAKYPAVSNVVGGWIGKLSNNSEDIELLNNLGVRIDKIDYADEGDWGVRQLGPLDHGMRGWEWSNDHDGGGKSLELIAPSLENAYGQNWKTSITAQGTPGVANSVAGSNVAPVILDAKHYPRIPSSTDAVSVTAQVIDESSAINTVTLYYRIDMSVYQSSVYPSYNPAAYTTVPMVDDGLHGDDLAGDGIYGATIPAQSDTTIIEFFIEAADTSANSRTWPAPSLVDGTPEQVTNLLYQADDNYDPNAVWTGGSQPIYRFILTNAEKDRLRDMGDGGDEINSNAQMNATFISIDGVDIKDRYNVGIRNRGQSTRVGPSNNYRVNFVHDAKWKKISGININHSYPYSQLIGNVVFQMAGLAAPDSQDIQLRVNGEDLSQSGGLMYGSYVHNEAFGGDFADNHFPDDNDGNLYKAQIWVDGALPSPWLAGLYYEGPNPSDYTDAGYYKDTNEEYNDWSDLINLTNILDNAPDETYSAQVEAVVDVNQWVRWFAVNNLIGNNETSLGTGRGDDYRLYIGINDPRAKLVVHDMDTVLGLGDSPNDAQDPIFRAADPVHLPIIERFLEHPDFAPLYYAELKELCETVFSPEQFDPVIDKVLDGLVPQSTVDAVKQFAVNRVASVLSQIPTELTATSSLSLSDGLYRTTSNSGSLSGYADAINTRAVTVNSHLAAWNAADAQWTFEIAGSGLTLNPGINRLKVQSYGDPGATGEELAHESIDVWYDTASETVFAGGTLASNTTFDLASSPWRVTSNIIVPAGVTLTIEPGTTVNFDSGTGITVNGRLLAEGTEYQRIRLSRVPNSGASWNGLIFQNSLHDSRLAHIDMSYGDARGNSILIEYSQVLIDNMTWPNSTQRAIEVLHPSLIARNCVFHGINGEVIHGEYIENSEYLTLENNIFERGHTGGDIIDFLGAERPGPVFKVIDNIFMGGPDDGIDLDGTDAHVEGNIFMDFHKETTRDTTSNCIATGLPQTGGANRTEITVARNVFYGSDHGILLKEEAFATIENNVFVGMDIAAMQFNEIGGTANMGPSNGADIEGNIFFDNADLFQNQFSPDLGQWPDPVVTVNNSIIDFAMHTLGVDNIDADPSFIDDKEDFQLMPKSAGIGTGPNARDMGAFPIAGATVSGEPGAVTNQTTATLTVDGPGISHYQYRLMDNGAWAGGWSGEYTIDTPIVLASLQDGHSYTVYTKGRSIDDVWPGDPDGNASHTWTVDVGYSQLMINEVLAHSHGTDPDIIELYCEGASSFDMEDMSITDDPNEPRKYVFPAGTTINPGQYLVYYADLSLDPGHLGFSLYSNGEGLYLYDKLASGGGLIDSVEFGIQPNSISIGRVGWAKDWKLTYQTFGQANEVCPLDNPKNIKINEWLANGQVLFEDDFIELYNPGKQPVDLSGFYISDDAAARRAKHRFADLSFIAGEGYVYLFADDDESEGADHLNFNLSSDHETITLMDQDLKVIDKVTYLSQTTDVSEGRSPNGSGTFAFFDLPTPGIMNKTYTVDVTITTESIFPIDASWSYYQSGAAPASWMDAGFVDTGWPTGNALLYVESSSLPAPKNTPLTLGRTAYYFRRHFTIDDPNLVDELQATVVIDDGAVFYINGVEVLRHGMQEDITITYSTLANRTIDNAGLETITIPADALVEGDNVIAVEVHQTTTGSSDIVFGMSLDAVNVTTVITEVNPYVDDEKVLDGLRITEMMYSPSGDPDLEYIELKNISGITIDITDVRFVDGIDYQFPSMTLAPGEYVVIAADEIKFEAQYPGVDAVGQYVGKLNNGGERIVMTLANPPLEAAVMRFDYNNTWYPSTDGAGSALEIIDPTIHPAEWDNAESWQAITPSPGGP